jgi:hypothetical protein
MNIELNTEADTSVKVYTNSVIMWAKQFDPDIDYRAIEETVNNVDEDGCAAKITIATAIGAVVVFPDFTRNSAKAVIVNVGRIKNLEKEGFELDHIMNNEPVYGMLLDFSESNCKLLGYYLSNKISLASTQPL